MSVAELKPLLALIFQVCKKYLSRKGPDFPFMYEIKCIHKFPKDSSVPMEATLPISKTVKKPFQKHDTVDNKLIAEEKFNSACYRKVRFFSEFVVVIINSAVSLLSILQLHKIT